MTTPLDSALADWRMKDDATRDTEAMEAQIAGEVDAFLASEDMTRVLGRRDLDFTRIFTPKR